MFKNIAVIIWLSLILYKSVDYYNFKKNVRELKQSEQKSKETVNTGKKVVMPDFDPEWKGTKTERNKSKRLKTSFDGWMSTKDKAAKENN